MLPSLEEKATLLSGWVYLAVVLDLYSRHGCGFAMMKAYGTSNNASEPKDQRQPVSIPVARY